MKKLIVTVLLIFFVTSFASADRWCQWSGTAGINCRNDSAGVLRLPFPTRTEALINAKGFYRVTNTHPTVGEDQTKDVEVWDLVGNQMSLTWTVRDLTTAEIDSRDAEPMPRSEYFLWSALVAGGVFTGAQIAAFLQANAPELVEAYQARDRIENP